MTNHSPTIRYFLRIAYRGTAYHGWQIQPNAPSLQSLFNEKLGLLLGEEIYCIGCGRTDTGVHAREFFLHFDSARTDLGPALVFKLNSFLPQDVAVYNIYRAIHPEAHSRWSAVQRSYTYIISRQKDPFMIGYAAPIYFPLDIDAMNAAAAVMLEFQDFEALCKVSEDQKHHLCRIDEAVWQLSGDKLVFSISANRFLRGMVRLVVGTLLQVGRGKMTVEQFRALLESRNRVKAGGAAPAEGLYLSRVIYPEGVMEEII